MLYALCGLWVLLCWLGPAAAAPAGDGGWTRVAGDPIGVKRTVPSNGLTVLVSENPELPSVFGAVVVRAGGKHDPAHATGIAHYLEHMLFKGTAALGTTNYEAERPHIERIEQLYEQLRATRDERGARRAARADQRRVAGGRALRDPPTSSTSSCRSSARRA